MLRKGISPVIATVIIVAVAIAIAVAVAFWITGIVGLFTRYEKLEIINAYADWNDTYGTWVVVLQVRNAGSSDATIDEIFINGRPHDAWASLNLPNSTQYGYVMNKKIAFTANNIVNASAVGYLNGVYINLSASYSITLDKNVATVTSFDFKNGVPLKAGQDMTIVILIPGPGNPGGVTADFKHGTSIEIKLHTAAGKEYPKEIVLP